MSSRLIFGIAAFGGLLLGYDAGVVSGALLFLRSALILSATPRPSSRAPAIICPNPDFPSAQPRV